MEADQHVLVVSLVVGRRAVPIYWRAYHASVFKGRMKRYELAVIRRAVGRVAKAVGTRRVIVTADRGFADVALFTLLSQLGITFIIRVKAGTHVSFQGKWCKWRSEEHTSELQSPCNLVCRLLLEKKKKNTIESCVLHNGR